MEKMSEELKIAEYLSILKSIFDGDSSHFLMFFHLLLCIIKYINN